MSEEWGPWIEHCGTKQPVKDGTWVYVLLRDGDTDEYYAEDFGWEWNSIFAYPEGDIIRYRIRKPKALQQLKHLIENLPAPSKETVTT